MLLRDGPERLPRSWTILVATSLATLLLSVLTMELTYPKDEAPHNLIVMWMALMLLFYYAVLQVSGYLQRYAQCMSAIMGTDFVLTAIILAVFLILGLVTDNNTALRVAWLMSNWSILVQGHIIARTIQQHWGIGIIIALGLHIMLLLAESQLIDKS